MQIYFNWRLLPTQLRTFSDINAGIRTELGYNAPDNTSFTILS